jgi:antitoxin MazE
MPQTTPVFPRFDLLCARHPSCILIVDTTGGFTLTARVQKWGNSLALRLPKALADELRLEQGSAVELRVVDGKLIVEPHRPPQYRLEDLLKKVSKRNLHAEIKTGRPVGKEAL